jgi:hypothetical protein
MYASSLRRTTCKIDRVRSTRFVSQVSQRKFASMHWHEQGEKLKTRNLNTGLWYDFRIQSTVSHEINFMRYNGLNVNYSCKRPKPHHNTR